MKSQRIQILVGFFLTVSIVVVFRVVNLPETPVKLLKADGMEFLKNDIEALEQDKIDLQREEIALKKAKLQDKKQAIPVWRNIKYSAGAGIAVMFAASLLLVSLAYRQKLLTHVLRIGQNEIPVKDKDLSRLAPEVSTSLALAQTIEAQAPQKAVELYLALADVNTRQLKALAGRVQIPVDVRVQEPAALPMMTKAPTFAELFTRDDISPGKPLCMGYAGDVPQHRDVIDIKALSVAGWQGSGKTLSMGYLSTCFLLQYPGSFGYVIDPHRDHPESLGALLRPLTNSGRLHIVNPLDLPETMGKLNTILNDRLSGKTPSDPLIFVIIDEMSRLGRMEIFKASILPFVERCTEETRKANMLFIGAGQKWQARYFGNNADIRQTMPSLLVHKTKPSQAALLLEDADEKRLVKQLTEAGQALLSTSHDADPTVVKMPLITKADIYNVAQLLQVNGPVVDVDLSVDHIPNYQRIDHPVDQDVDRENTGLNASVDLIEQVNAYLKNDGNTLTKLAESTGMDKGYLSKIINRKKSPSESAREKLTAVLSTCDTSKLDNVLTFRPRTPNQPTQGV